MFEEGLSDEEDDFEYEQNHWEEVSDHEDVCVEGETASVSEAFEVSSSALCRHW